MWNKLSQKEIKERVNKAIEGNLNYDQEPIFGLPGSILDQEEFYKDAPFLKNAPYLSTFVKNPNHIGCHTITEGEPYFAGTQGLEKELIAHCAQMFRAQPEEIDGYVASGGTEGNIEGVWIYRNYFQEKLNLKAHEIGVLFSEDTHYSSFKSCNLLGTAPIPLAVDEKTRQINPDGLKNAIAKAQKEGVKAFVWIANMCTTMFGSVDDVDQNTAILDDLGIEYFVHIDAAFGGFIYPFTQDQLPLSFQHPRVFSVSIDAHKMLQTPYGTGVFLIRKGFIHYAMTEEARYVKGHDYTLIGSRSGANAVVIWMMMKRYGLVGWQHKCGTLIEHTERIMEALDEKGIRYFNQPGVNIITMYAADLPPTLAQKYHLVADDYDHPQFYKIVMMHHISKGQIDQFILDLNA